MASTDDQGFGRHWLFRYVVPSLVLVLSALWFLQERSYESAITLVTSAAVLGGVLLSQGRIAVAFIGGFVLGGALATFVAYKTFSTVPSEPTLSSEELSAREREVSGLKEQNEKLESELNLALNKNKELLRQLQENPVEVPKRQELLQELPIFEAKASSFRRSSVNFPPKNIINKIIRPQYNRSWQSESGDLKGAWLEFYLPEKHTIGRIRMYMLINDGSRGGQIRDAKLSFPDGSSQDVRFPFEQGWHSIDLKKTEADLVRLEVLSVYPGNNGANNLEVVELELYGE